MINSKNSFFLGYLTIYVVFPFLLRFIEGFSTTELMVILVVVGIGFSGVAFLLTRSSKPLPITLHAATTEMWTLLALILLATIYLIWGKDTITSLLHNYTQDSPFRELLLDLVRKVILFVAFPLLLFLEVFKYSLGDFGIQFGTTEGLWRKHFHVSLGMAEFGKIINGRPGPTLFKWSIECRDQSSYGPAASQ